MEKHGKTTIIIYTNLQPTAASGSMIFDIVFFLGQASEKVHKRCQGLGIYTNHAVIDLDASKFIAGNMCGIHTEPSNRINRCHGEHTKIIKIALYGKLYGSSSPQR